MDGEVKPGWKTTEFWGKNLVQLVSLAATILSLTGKVNMTPDQQQSVVTVGLSVIGAVEAVYALVRGWTKSK